MYEIPVATLAQKLAETLQYYSQRVGVRPFCASIIIVGCDEEFGPQVFKVDPAGQVLGYKAACQGQKE